MKQKKQDSVKIWNCVWRENDYAEPLLRQEKARKKIDLLLQWIPEKLDSNSIVIDAGCGGGYLSEYLASKTGARVEGFDQSSKAINICKKRKKISHMNFTCCDAADIPYASEWADVIVCVGLIEHIREHRACIQELRRVLKKDGYIYIVSSNKYSVMYLQWIWKNLLHRWKYGYQKNWTPGKLNKFLNEQLFDTVKMEVIEGIGNFEGITRADHFLRKWNKWCGRYIVYLGKKR